ncbi:MAG: N-acetylmuramoyl-L-alanine amidase [Sphingobacteriales bacterium]|nr:MAG: N-acetylmuramoyl-L-alanine amidase [Sphingobacteriales bacterium]
MIASILSFSLKSMACSAVFAGYYLLVLRNTQLHRFNRAYLLLTVLLSVILPFTHFELFSIAPIAVADFPVLDISGKGADEDLMQLTASRSFDWQQFAAMLYFIVPTIIVVKIIAKSIWIHGLKRKGQRSQRDGFVMVRTDDPRAPFSFMNTLFWPVHMREDSAEGGNILMHELAHIRQHHTIDKILMQLMLAATWLNPFNWLMKKELWLQHEFLADKYAIKDSDGETFARMLLYSVTNTPNTSIVNPFFQSPVKRRLLMLTQGKGSYSFMRRFLTVPVLAATVLLLSADTKAPNVVRSPEKIVLVLDVGHGGIDVGAKGAHGHIEKDITLAISKKLVSLSDEYNIQVVTSRDADVYPTLQDRAQIGNAVDNAIFISLHVNASTVPDKRIDSYMLGINTKGARYEESKLLASALANRLQAQKLDAMVVERNSIYVVRESKHPALLIECGNIDDADNMAMLDDETRRETLCRNILNGIVDYSLRAQKK